MFKSWYLPNTSSTAASQSSSSMMRVIFHIWTSCIHNHAISLATEITHFDWC
jgi:hypothetical protein